MSAEDDLKSLDHEHTREAISERLAAATEHNYLGDFVLGAIDGAVTTFAVVSGSAGAGLPAGVAVVLGFANIFADGFSMAVSNYFSTKSEHELLDRARRREERHIDQHPEGEREEIRQIFEGKGFQGDLLENITETITGRRKLWVDTMLTEELGLQLEPPHPVRAASATFVAFLLAGLVPLLPLLLSGRLEAGHTFLISAVATAATFAVIGAVKGRVTHRSLWRSMGETLLIGGCAATLAYVAGAVLKGFADNHLGG